MSMNCPCCGQGIPPTDDLHWSGETRTLSGRGHILHLSPMRGRIFDKLWRCWPKGHMVQLSEMMEWVYADRRDGGPETQNVVSVQLVTMRKLLAPFGISIQGRSGYLIYRTDVKLRKAGNRHENHARATA